MKLKQNEAFPGPKVGPQAPGRGSVLPPVLILSNAACAQGEGGCQAQEVISFFASGETESQRGQAVARFFS